jgi:hypothetical protein
VEGCESGGGRGRCEGAFCEGSCVGRCQFSLRGLDAREADRGAIAVEVRASLLFECLGGWIDDAHACEVCCLAVRQYVKQTEKVSADSPGGRRYCREEEEIAVDVVVLVVKGESSIITGVYERWCSSTLHIRWGLCDRLCLVLVCGAGTVWGGGSSLHLGSNLGRVGPVRVFGGEEEGGVVISGAFINFLLHNHSVNIK